MARSGYWLMEFLSISQFLRQAPAQYVTAYPHRDGQRDTTYFIAPPTGHHPQGHRALYAYLARKTHEQKGRRTPAGERPWHYAADSITGR